MRQHLSAVIKNPDRDINRSTNKIVNYKTMNFILHQQFLKDNNHEFRIMKSAVTFLLVCFFAMYATEVRSQNVKVSIQAKNLSIQSVLKEIEKRTGYFFVYDKNEVDVSRKTSLDKTNESVSDILDKVFDGTDTGHRLMGKNIILFKKKVTGDSAKGQKLKKKITGTVIDQQGEPIIGANVLEKGTTNGIITGLDGNFTLTVSEQSTVVFSFIGYTTAELVVSDRTDWNIVLKEDTELLEEVVVIGYGTMKKKDLTGAVGAVKGTDLAARKTTQLSTALQGAVSGVLVTRTNGEPGANSSIQIRGVTTIGESAPLVIIDGVPGDINQVSPDDVESMSVLKDAASASIYGSRAAAGVIVITTKRAKEQDLSLNYNYEYGWEMPTKLPEYVGAQRFLEMSNELRYNDNPDGGWFQQYPEEQVNNWMKRHAVDPENYPDTDWQELILKDSAPRQTHSISIAGGSKVVRTKASFRYDKTEGLYANKNYERYMFRVNNDIKINKYIEAHLDVNFKRSKADAPHTNPLTLINRAIPPIYAARWENGQWGDVKDGENTLAKITDGGSKTSWYNRIGGKAAIDITPLEGLKLSAVVAPTYNFNKVKSFRKQVPYTYANNPDEIIGYMRGFKTTYLNEERNDDYDVTTQLFANYNKTFGKHDASVMIGYEDYYAFGEKLSASRDQYELTDYPYLDIGPKTLIDNSGKADEYAYRSFFGRVTYSYENRYLLQANFRRDGSSRFAANNRWGNFPSFSAGWVVSEEDFMKKLDWKWLSYLKLRGSWGTLGNERLESRYPYQANLNFDNVLFHQGGKISSELSAAQRIYAVKNISWETTETWNVGVDAHFFNNRLTFSGEFYKKKTKDMLLAMEIPNFIGYDNPQVNAGSMHTTGYDLDFGWRDQIGSFSYAVSANLSDFVSEMGNLNGTEFLGDQIKKEGSEFNEWYGYLSDGLFQTQEEVDNSPKINNNVKVGDIKYKDISGPDGVPDGIISSEYDRVQLGGSLPRYMYGINMSASYKGFDVSMVFQGIGKQNVRVTSSMYDGLTDNWLGFPSLLEGDYWSSKNTSEENQHVKYPRLTNSGKKVNNAMSDYWLFNGRYLRMKNLTIGYTLPSDLLNKMHVESIRFYVSGSDLFCISNYPSGWDPEVSASGYPITTSVLLGVSVNF